MSFLFLPEKPANTAAAPEQYTKESSGFQPWS